MESLYYREGRDWESVGMVTAHAKIVRLVEDGEERGGGDKWGDKKRVREREVGYLMELDIVLVEGSDITSIDLDQDVNLDMTRHIRTLLCPLRCQPHKYITI